MKKLTPIQLEVRDKMITLAVKQGLSFKEVVELFSRQISKSRVYQIFNSNK